MGPVERYVTVEQVAEHLSVSRSTVYQWVNAGFVPHYKVRTVVRFKLSEVENWMKRRKIKGREKYRLEIDL